MSRVTIGDIAEDLLPFTEEGNKVITIEIVPRKIVEDIMNMCVNIICTTPDEDEQDIAYRIYHKVESLLKQFEGDDLPHTCRFCKNARCVSQMEFLYRCKHQPGTQTGEATCKYFEEGSR